MTVNASTSFVVLVLVAGLLLPGAEAACCNVPPNDWYTCQELQALDKCTEDWMEGYCCQTCFGCNATCLTTLHDVEFSTTLTPTTRVLTCADEPVDELLSCAEQSALGNCDEPWLQTACCSTCHDCAVDCLGPGQSTTTTATLTSTTTSAVTCSDISPSQHYTCAEHAFGPAGNKCSEPWMDGFCCQTCTACSGECLGFHTTEAPLCLNESPDDFYTCEEQELLGNCGEDWMDGSCCHTCSSCDSECLTNTSSTPPYVATTILITSAAFSMNTTGDRRMTGSVSSFIQTWSKIAMLIACARFELIAPLNN